MKSNAWTKSNENRRSFIGGSDARIIMGNDEEALLRLWREKRGEAETQDFSGNLLIQLGLATEGLNRRWYERTTGEVIKDLQSWIRHPAIRWMAATLDGVVESTGAVFEAKFMLPWVVLGRNGGGEAYAPSAAQYVGDQCQRGGALDHHRRR